MYFVLSDKISYKAQLRKAIYTLIRNLNFIMSNVGNINDFWPDKYDQSRF